MTFPHVQWSKFCRAGIELRTYNRQPAMILLTAPTMLNITSLFFSSETKETLQGICSDTHRVMNSEVNAITNEFTRTEILLRAKSMSYHTPIVWARSATGRRKFTTKLMASILSSKALLIKANKGARGKAATNIVTNPYWITFEREIALIILISISKVWAEKISLKHPGNWATLPISRVLMGMYNKGFQLLYP